MSADAAVTNEDLKAGTILDGRYEIEAELGEGGIGKVYRGRHLRLDRPVAIKVLLTQHRDQSALQARFEREAQALSSLSHPNIVTVTDFGIADGLPFLVMELVEGRDLSEVLSDGALPPARAYHIARQILRSLAYAHDRGIVHRDLKPANVLLRVLPDGSDHVEVLDFGLAKFIDGSGPSSELTRTGAILGSPAYMSPEQAGGGEADARADVYAMGLILFELLSGRRPFLSKRVTELLKDHLVSVPPKLSEVVTGMEIDPALETLISRSLSKTPAERYLNAAEMLTALEAIGESSARWVSDFPPPPAIADEAMTRAARPAKGSSEMGHLATMAATSPEVGSVVAPRAPRDSAGSTTYAPVEAPKRFAAAAALGAVGFVVVIGGIIALAFLSADEGDSPSVEASTSVRVGTSVQAGSDEGSAAREKPAASSPAQDLLRAVVGGGSSSGPWAEVPDALAPYHARVAAGRPLQRSQIRKVRDYGRANPTDPRSFLLLGRSYTLDRALSYAVPEYQQALQIDKNAIEDPNILGDLLEAARSRSQARNAGGLIRTYWGAKARPALEQALAGNLRSDERSRIEDLLGAL